MKCNMDKFGVNKDNNGILNNSHDKLEFINDIMEKITTHYTIALSNNLVDISIKTENNLNRHNIAIVTKNPINENSFSDFELSMKIFAKLYNFELNFWYNCLNNQ